MSPRLKTLSAREIMRALGTFGFEVVATRGSHAKLRRVRRDGTDILTIPLHKELAPGTVRAINTKTNTERSRNEHGTDTETD